MLSHNDLTFDQVSWPFELLRAESEFGRHRARVAGEGSARMRSLSARERAYSAWLRERARALAEEAAGLRGSIASLHSSPER